MYMYRRVVFIPVAKIKSLLMGSFPSLPILWAPGGGRVRGQFELIQKLIHFCQRDFCLTFMGGGDDQMGAFFIVPHLNIMMDRCSRLVRLQLVALPSTTTGGIVWG